jgi:hypothetical protein
MPLCSLIGSKLTLFKGNELYLCIVKWQHKTANEDEMQKKMYTAGNLRSLLVLFQVCGQRCCSPWLRLVIVNFACNYHHSELCGFRLRIHQEIPRIINKWKTKISLIASKSVTWSVKTFSLFVWIAHINTFSCHGYYRQCMKNYKNNNNLMLQHYFS